MQTVTNAFPKNGIAINTKIARMHRTNVIAKRSMKVKRENQHLEMLAHSHSLIHKIQTKEQGESAHKLNKPIDLCSWSSILFSPPFVLIPPEDRLNSAEAKPSGKTKLSLVPANHPIDILNKAKHNHVKHNKTRNDEFNSDEDEIQGDASGLTVPLSKSLGKNRSFFLNISHH